MKILFTMLSNKIIFFCISFHRNFLFLHFRPIFIPPSSLPLKKDINHFLFKFNYILPHLTSLHLNPLGRLFILPQVSIIPLVDQRIKCFDNLMILIFLCFTFATSASITFSLSLQLNYHEYQYQRS